MTSSATRRMATSTMWGWMRWLSSSVTKRKAQTCKERGRQHGQNVRLPNQSFGKNSRREEITHYRLKILSLNGSKRRSIPFTTFQTWIDVRKLPPATWCVVIAVLACAPFCSFTKAAPAKLLSVMMITNHITWPITRPHLVRRDRHVCDTYLCACWSHDENQNRSWFEYSKDHRMRSRFLITYTHTSSMLSRYTCDAAPPAPTSSQSRNYPMSCSERDICFSFLWTP